jgi:hypothetical protein
VALWRSSPHLFKFCLVGDMRRYAFISEERREELRCSRVGTRVAPFRGMEPTKQSGSGAEQKKQERFFELARSREWKHSLLAAFGSTRRANRLPEDDPNLQALIRSEAPVTPASVFHVWENRLPRRPAIPRISSTMQFAQIG